MKKLITRPKYEGLDPDIAKELLEGKEVYGEFWNSLEFVYLGYLNDYLSDNGYSFYHSNGNLYKYFKPIYKEETDWTKVPEGTPIYVWDCVERPEKPLMNYFKRYCSSMSSPFITTWSSYKHAELIPEFQKEK